MRIWSLHPQYLDGKGLVALWREALLAKHVLEEKTKGYKNHPQLNRFKELKNPLNAINFYLAEVYAEACRRKYQFDKEKISLDFSPGKISVTRGQMEYEAEHLLNKLNIRDIEKYDAVKSIKIFSAHPLFKIMPGGVEDWEIITESASKKRNQ